MRTMLVRLLDSLMTGLTPWREKQAQLRSCFTTSQRVSLPRHSFAPGVVVTFQPRLTQAWTSVKRISQVDSMFFYISRAGQKRESCYGAVAITWTTGW